MVYNPSFGDLPGFERDRIQLGRSTFKMRNIHRWNSQATVASSNAKQPEKTWEYFHTIIVTIWKKEWGFCKMWQAWDCSWILLWKTVTNKEVSRRDDCSRRYWNIDHSSTGILLFDWVVMIGCLIDLLTDRLSIQWFWWSLAFAKAWWNLIDQFFNFYRASPNLSSLLIVHIITCMDLYNL